MNAQRAPRGSTSLVTKMAERFSVDADKLMNTLKATAFKQRDGTVPSNEQMMALLVVADQYKLNPFTREIYAFPDKQNGIVPVVGVDGWSRIINEHPNFDGLDFRESSEMITLDGAKPAPEWMECVIYRKDRSHPIVIREYLDEVYRPAFKKQGQNGPYTIDGPWQSHTKRFLRHKTMIQCARIAFGFVGIFDQDEAERIVEAQAREFVERKPTPMAALPHLTADKFDGDFAKWQAAIEQGKKTVSEIIAMVSTKYTLSDEQRKVIEGIQPKVEEIIDADFIAEMDKAEGEK